jgi:V/A-type H+-transporting ATPase subunit E
MAEELKHLIDQIQKEGVEKAEEQATAILSQAKERAAKIVTEAEQKAADLLAKSETEAEAFAERSVRTLEQAARDLLITVGQGCEKVVTETLGQQVDKAIDGGLLEKMVLNVIEQHKGESAEFSVNEADQKALTAFCAKQAKKSGQEIELVSDAEVLSGFKVGFKGSNAYLDFTGEAVAEALASFLRPELAKIVSNVAREQLAKA